MRIAYNPKTAAALSQAPANNDITFDLSGLSIYVRGVRFKGTDTTYSVFKKHDENGGGYDGLVPVPDYNNGLFNRFLREDGTWQYIAGSSDINVYQSEDDTSDFRPVILGLTHSANLTELVDPVTGQVYVTAKIYACPSTGVLYATKLFSNGKEVLTEHQSLEDYVTLSTPQTIIGRKTFYTQVDISNGDKNADDSLYKRPIIYMDASKNMIYSDHKAQTIIRGFTIKLQTSNEVDTVNILPDTVKTIAKIVSDSTIQGTQFISTIEDAPPLVVNSATLVAKLNSDLLDGYHVSGLFEKLENDGNNLSITIGGTKKNLIVNYATQSGKLGYSIKFKNTSYQDVTFDGSKEIDLTGGIYYSLNSDYAKLLKINSTSTSTIATGVGTWAPISGKEYVFRQKWTNSAASSDTADLAIYLDGNLTANMCLDGYYYSLSGFKKSGSDDNYALTGNGGHMAIHTGRNNEANKIVRTDTSGYLQTGWINTTSGDMGTSDINRIYCSNDDYIRYKTLTNFSSDIAGQLYWANVKVSTSSNATTTPTFGKLYISGAYPHIDMTSTSAESSIYFRPTSGTSWAIGKAPWGVGGFGIGILGDGSKFTILDNGNVGIGITSPSYKLDIAGNIRISSHLYASTTNMTGAILKVYDEGNNYGQKVVLGSGGTTLIGAGESADVLANYYTDENLYLSADGDVNIFTHLDGGWDSRKHAACFSNNGNTYIYGGLHIGSSSSNNYIAFYGNTGDAPGSYQTSFIGEHLWGSPESTELLLMKFNDIGNGTDATTVYQSGPDRIRHLAHGHVFQIMTNTTQGDFATMANSTAVETKFDIARYQLHAYAPLAIISDGTNSGYDGLVYMRHYSNNDWGLIVDKSQSYTYGVDIRAGGGYALRVGNGNTRLLGATIIGADATPSYTLDVRGHIRATENLIISTNNTTGGGIIFADDGDIVDLNDAFCTMRFTSGIRITNANRGGSVVHELNANGKLYNYGLYHYSYGNYDYLLTSNGDARHINSLPYAPWKEQWIDMTGYSESYWHPVVTGLPYSGYRRIKVTVQLNSGTKPSWSTHSSGFTCNLDLWVTAHGWGTTSSETICLNSTYAFTDQNPVGWSQLGNRSLGILLLRGGGRYLVCTDWDTSWTIHNQSITDYAGTQYQQTCGPYTSWPGIFNGSTNKNWIYANTRGNIITDDWLSIRDYSGSYHGRSNNISGYAGEIWFGGNFHIDSQNGYKLYLNYYTSATVSIAQGGGNVGIGTDSPGYKLDVRGNTRSTGRIYANEWIQFDNWTGLYSPNNNAHFYPNNTTSYGQWQLRGNRNSYSGIHFGDSTHYMTIMDNYSDKGVYQEDWGWLWYYNARNGHYSIRTSSDFGADISLNGSVRTNSTYYGYGLYHLSYGSSNYFLTSDGGARYWPDLYDGRYLRYEGWWSNGSGQNVNDSLGMNFTYTSHGAPHHWGTTVTFEYSRNSSYRLQLHGTGDNYLYFRNRSADYGGWHSSGWKQILTNQDTYVASDGTNRGIINGAEVQSARHLLINGVTWNSDWYWSGQGGQPSWLWGSNDGVNMYVWNPSNFSVNYANSAGTANKLSTNAGSSTRPVYFSNGIPVACGYSFKGLSTQPVVLVSGYFYRNYLNQNTWYFTGYKHSEIGSPSFSVNGGVMTLTFSNTVNVYFISACAQSRLNFSGRGNISTTQSASNTEYSWRSEGAYWFNTYVSNSSKTSYLYIRSFRLADKNNDSWGSYSSSWKQEEDAIHSVSFTIFGYI